MKRKTVVSLILCVCLLALTQDPFIYKHTVSADTTSYYYAYADSVTYTTGSESLNKYYHTHQSNNTRHQSDGAGGLPEILDYHYTLNDSGVPNTIGITEIQSKIECRMGSAEVPSTATLYWYDYDGTSWVSMGSLTLSEVDQTTTDTQTTNLARFLNDTSGEFQVRVYLSDDALAVFQADWLQVRFTFVIDDAGSDAVQVTYSISDKCSWDWYEFVTYQNNATYEILNHMSYMMKSDNEDFIIYIYDENSEGWSGTFYFTIDSPYTHLKEMNYDCAFLESGGTLEIDDMYIYIFDEDSKSTTSFTDSDGNDDTGTTTLGSNYVVDGKIHGAVYYTADDTSSLVDQITIYLDQLAFEYNDVTESVTSVVDYWSDGTERHTIEVTTFDYDVNVSFTPATSWTFHSVNPNCTVDTSGSTWDFSNTVPMTYTIIANSSYTEPLNVQSSSFSFSDFYVYAFIKPNMDCSYMIYENDTLQGSGSILKEGSSVSWMRDTTDGVLVLVGILCFYGGHQVWVNTSYSNALPDDATLYIVGFGAQTNYDEVKIWFITSWRNTSVTIIDEFAGVNSTKFNGVPEGQGIWVYEAPHENGEHLVYVLIDGGADSLSRTFNYTWHWYVPTEPIDDIGIGPLAMGFLWTISSNQFYQSLLFGLGIVGIGVALAVWRRRDASNVWVDEKTGQILKKKRLKKKRVKVKKPSAHDKGKSTYEELEGLLEEQEL